MCEQGRMYSNVLKLGDVLSGRRHIRLKQVQELSKVERDGTAVSVLKATFSAAPPIIYYFGASVLSVVFEKD